MRSVVATVRDYWLSLLFVASNFVVLGSLHARLPDPLPIWWSNSGEMIGSMAMPWGALLLPLAQLLLTIFLIVAPIVDPGALRAPEARRFYPMAVAIIAGFLLYTTSLIFAAALAVPVRVSYGLFGGIGVLFALIGNYLGKIPKNYMVGIRTPWTLSSEYVWERTHRFAAPVFVVSGIALVVYCLLQRSFISSYAASAVIVATILAPYCYSYLLWKRTGHVDVA